MKQISWDCHMHSSFSGDSEAPMELMIQEGIRKGLSGLCFTEHLDLDFPDTPEPVDFTIDFPSYYSAFCYFKDYYQDQLTIHYGLELGLQPHLSTQFDALMKCHSFDYVIGSVHLLDGQDPYYPEVFAGKDEASCYQRYFESILENLQAYSSFDALGHLDYVVRYGPNRNREYHYENHREILDAILMLLINKDIALELNTAGYNAGLGSPNPSAEVLKRYKELGGQMITIGSDAHTPERISSCFSDAANLLEFLGYTSYTVFHNRTPIFYPLKK